MSPTMVCRIAEAMPESGERVTPEVPDQRRIDDEEERLGDQRAERGHGEPQDVAVQRLPGLVTLRAYEDRRAQHPFDHDAITACDRCPRSGGAVRRGTYP